MCPKRNSAAAKNSLAYACHVVLKKILRVSLAILKLRLIAENFIKTLGVR